MSLSLANINSPQIWFAFLTALFVIEAFLLTTFRMFPRVWGDLINVWYDKFGLVAIMLDCLIVLIGFWISQWLYKYFFGDSDKSFVLWKFILLFLAVQIAHDFLFYFLILKNSSGSNSIIDLIKSYGNKHGALTVLGDSLMVVLAILVAYGLLQSNAEFSTYIICMLLSLYFIGYLLYSKWQ